MELDLRGINVDSLIQMLKASFTLENWDGILLIADKLYTEIDSLYTANQRERADGRKVRSLNLQRPIVYYFGYSMCLKGIALQKIGRYEEARACIDKYSELGWINEIDAEGMAEVEYYREIAAANRYVIDLNKGNTAILPAYIRFLQDNEEEILPGLIHILESAIKFKYNVDEVLSDFQEKITSMREYYEKERNIRYYVDYIYLEAKYYSINGKQYDAINKLLTSLASSIKLRDDTGFRKSAVLFELLRDQSNSIQLNEYKQLMKQILD
ncbi:DNA-binding protein [Paenibacillus donghaensis]|uniref:DNA-binding protein n=1 Tax=Paenibacillus donghaensis TaxID=414771 RepID=A0A2Z2K8I4_9BACL|nr:DNA-binding protein [Paenibacillus donghaensis]ASA21634.1 hypothetical protein B9T62_13150 [Paenibacillus donghaensis]